MWLKNIFSPCAIARSMLLDSCFWECTYNSFDLSSWIGRIAGWLAIPLFLYSLFEQVDAVPAKIIREVCSSHISGWAVAPRLRGRCVLMQALIFMVYCVIITSPNLTSLKLLIKRSLLVKQLYSWMWLHMKLFVTSVFFAKFYLHHKSSNGCLFDMGILLNCK